MCICVYFISSFWLCVQRYVRFPLGQPTDGRRLRWRPATLTWYVAEEVNLPMGFCTGWAETTRLKHGVPVKSPTDDNLHFVIFTLQWNHTEPQRPLPQVPVDEGHLGAGGGGLGDGRGVLRRMHLPRPTEARAIPLL